MDQILRRKVKRDVLEASGLPLNEHVWFQMKNFSLGKVFKMIREKNYWPSIGASVDLVNPIEGVSAPVISQSDYKRWEAKDFIESQIETLLNDIKAYNGQTKWHPQDYVLFYSSPIAIPEALVGVSLQCEVYQFFHEDWGDCTGFPYHMPFILELQQGTWPRYFNRSESEKYRHTFVCIICLDRYASDKFTSVRCNILVKQAKDAVLNSLADPLMQGKIYTMAQSVGYDVINIDGQYIDPKTKRFDAGLKWFDFDGVKLTDEIKWRLRR